jgi:hypothetical protein
MRIVQCHESGSRSLRFEVWVVRKELFIALIVIASVGTASAKVLAQSKPLSVYVDKGACPFECCAYRDWKTEKVTIAYALPSIRSVSVGKFKRGSNVVALTGEVRTIPSRFLITKRHGKYKPGDVLWVYTPVGEGFYKVWSKGRMYQEGLDYVSGPFERTVPACEDAPDCWGKLERKLRVEWWVKIKSAEGWIGWTNQAENFSNKDSCG